MVGISENKLDALVRSHVKEATVDHIQAASMFLFWPTGAWDLMRTDADAPKAVAAVADLLARAERRMLDGFDPDTLEAVADEIDCFEHSARAGSLRAIARRQRAVMRAEQKESA